MTKTLLTFAAAALVGFQAQAASPDSEVHLITDAAAGASLRIQSQPFNGIEVSGADKSDFFGEYISKGPGTEIVIKGEIEQLEIYGCQLTSVDVVNAPDMFILKCNNNKLAELKVDKAPGLAVLDCSGNQLKSLNLSGATALEELNASSNNLQSVILSQMDKLKVINCSKNALLDIDLEGCPAVEDLYLYSNKLETLDLSSNTKLNHIEVFDNQIYGEAMNDFTDNLPEGVTSTMPAMLYIVDTRNDNEGNICLMRNVDSAKAKGWAVWDYAGGVEGAAYIGAPYYGADYVPETTDRYIKLSTLRKPGETIKLKITKNGDITIEGVQEAGVGGEITYTLTDQVVTIKGDVTSFECPDNDINALILEGESLLTYLDCRNNKIESLSLINAKDLKTVYAQKNALNMVNVNGCDKLLRIDVYQNKLKGAAMRKFVNSLYTASDSPYVFIIDTEAPEGTEENVATKADVKIARDKGWYVKDFCNEYMWGMGKNYEGSDGPDYPEEFFTFKTSGTSVLFNIVMTDENATPVVDGCEILGWNGSGLTLKTTPGQLATVYGDLTSMQALFSGIDDIDVSGLPHLLELNVGLNELKSVDLSGNAYLQIFSCEGNYITSLDFTANTMLSYVNCYGNQIKDADMTAMVSSLPDRAGKAAGEIVVFDPTYSSEGNICLVADVALAKDRNWDTYRLTEDGAEPYEGFDGVESVTVADDNAPIEYYDMQGRRVAAPKAGIYIERRGSKTVKRIFR